VICSDVPGPESRRNKSENNNSKFIFIFSCPSLCTWKGPGSRREGIETKPYFLSNKPKKNVQLSLPFAVTEKMVGIIKHNHRTSIRNLPVSIAILYKD
jgi:hypothetical protein